MDKTLTIKQSKQSTIRWLTRNPLPKQLTKDYKVNHHEHLKNATKHRAEEEQRSAGEAEQ